MQKLTRLAFCGMLAGILGIGTLASAQGPATRTPELSKAQAALAGAAESGKFAFIIFYKEDAAAFRTMAGNVKQGVETLDGKAGIVFVQVTNPAERALVERFDVSRSPMPLTIAVAPNGAVTGIFPKEITAEQIDQSIVTPTMTRCMKSLQENKMVFVCVQTSDKNFIPVAVKEMQADPQFKDRVTVVSMRLRDPEETRFVAQMQINPQTTTGTTAVLLAPPGVLIGKYPATATSAQIAAALHDAGKCCNDPNCKHGQGAAAQSNTSRRK